MGSAPQTPETLDLVNTIGRNLYKYRTSANWTMRKLECKAEVTDTCISHLEKGKHIPSLGTLARLAKALDIRVIDLFKEEL